ncbi:succinate dehydrogenase/fumarate reductase flavoprotein subunit, partial [Pseudomonas sp. MWU13-2860]
RRRFMERYAPNAKDLASRDMRTRGVVTEINEGRGCGPSKDHVLLDITHLDPEVIMSKLPGIREISIKFAGVDPIKAPIPVVPTCHYQMGGIPTNYHGEVVVHGEKVQGFYAAGECACASVHGANRLGTNSLLDLLVFGKSSANSMIEYIKQHPEDLPELDMTDVERSVARVTRLDSQTNVVQVHDARAEMQRVMQAHCGVFRFKDMLAEGVEKILQVADMVA